MSESRRPERQAWVEWNRDDSFATVEIDGVGVVESWYDVLVVSLPLVTFRGTIVFHADGTGVTSDSTLRFRTRDEIVESLEAARSGSGDHRGGDRACRQGLPGPASTSCAGRLNVDVRGRLSAHRPRLRVRRREVKADEERKVIEDEEGR